MSGAAGSSAPSSVRTGLCKPLVAQKPICDSLGSASRLGFVDSLSLSQIAHSREMTAGIHVMKEPGCIFLSAIKHEPWPVSPI